MQALRGTRSEGRAGRWLALAVGLLALWMGAGNVQAKDETGQWGQRLVEKFELPPEAVARALSAFGREARGTINQAGELDDADTADLFTEISRGIDKWLWFVEAHSQAKT